MKTAVIAGATGLVGSFLVRILLQDENYQKIIILVRNPIDLKHPKLEQIIFNFNDPQKEVVHGDEFYCCLGTTIKKAGSQQKFKQVDYEYPVNLAHIAHQNGMKAFAIITALGADEKSRFFYNKVKGETEKALIKIPFEKLIILRPSLLLGSRKEARFGEEAAKKLMTMLGFLFPKKLKGIHGSQVALCMTYSLAEAKQGVSIIESDLMHVFPRMDAMVK
jgi:uncharacterized protein YbjT (DUF2867 family)